MKNLRKQNTGFTLTELMVGSSIAVFAFSIIVSLGYMSRVFFQNTLIQTSVQSKGKITMDRMAREIRNAQAASITAGGDTIDITTYDSSTATTTVSRYALATTGTSVGGQTVYQLIYTPDINVNLSEVITNDLVKDAATDLFTNIDGSIRIKFEIREISIDNNYQTIMLDSQIRPRNI